jgi:hypothetical protein
MTRRRGQDGSIATSGRWRVVRFWIDVLGQNKRRHACERICPASGPGLLSATAQKRRAREIIAESGADTEEHFNKVVARNDVVTFRERAEWWLDWLQTRNVGFQHPVGSRQIANSEPWRFALVGSRQWCPQESRDTCPPKHSTPTLATRKKSVSR